MPHVIVAQRKLHYELDDFTRPWESAETLLIQHGMGRNAQFWRDWPPALAREFRLIRRDLPGHGGSEAPPPEHLWSLQELVDQTVEFLDAMELERVHFLAESTAGMLGVMLAAQHPDRLRSLILCACPTTIGPAAQAFFAGEHANWQVALQTLGTGGWARWLATQGGTMGTISDAQREWVIDQFARIPTHALVGYSKMVSREDVTPLLKEIRTPTLVLSPTRSSATPLAQQQALAAAIHGATMVVIDGSGHEIYADRAETCCAAVREFLLTGRSNQ